MPSAERTDFKAWSALQRRVLSAEEQNRPAVEGICETLFSHPELSREEFFSCGYLCDVLKKRGFSVETPVAGLPTAFRAQIGSGAPRVAFLAEYDALPGYGADGKSPAHACGHNVQLGALYGAAIGLIGSGAMDEPDGTVRFMAVPAEEGLEIQNRKKLIDEGKIRAFNGKQEFIRLGLFDGVSAALMQHTAQGDKVSAGGAGGLCVVQKLVRYTGKSAHPVNAHSGVNALTAARIGLNAADHMRDTMPGVYFHYTITECGAVNVIPDKVTLEAHVRGWDINYIKECNETINRCLKADAYAAGAEIEITDFSETLFSNEQADLKAIVLGCI